MDKPERDELLRQLNGHLDWMERDMPSPWAREVRERLRALFAAFDALARVHEALLLAHKLQGEYVETLEAKLAEVEAAEIEQTRKLADALDKLAEAEKDRERLRHTLDYIQREGPRISDISADADWPEVKMSVPGGFVSGKDLVECVERVAEIEAAMREGT
jgi:chromosome segregation ATPase